MDLSGVVLSPSNPKMNSPSEWPIAYSLNFALLSSMAPSDSRKSPTKSSQQTKNWLVDAIVSIVKQLLKLATFVFCGSYTCISVTGRLVHVTKWQSHVQQSIIYVYQKLDWSILFQKL